MANFSPVKSDRLSSMVARQILDRIATGSLKPGDPLPPETELMRLFEVSRSTLREALQALGAIGIVQTRSKVGTFVVENYANVINERLKLTLLLSKRDITYIMEVRRGLEIQTATLAAERATPTQKTTLNRLIAEMGASLNDVAKSTELDIDFHYTIAQATGNPVLIDLLLNVKSLISDYIRAGNLNGAMLDQDYAEHRRINDAIQAGSPEAAAGAMLAHLDSSRSQHLSMVDKPSAGVSGAPLNTQLQSKVASH